MGKFGDNEKNYSLKHCKAVLVLPHMSLAVYKDKLKKVKDSKAMSTRSLSIRFWLPAYLCQKYCKLLGKIVQCNRAMIFSATCVAAALQDKLLRKLLSVTAP